MKCAYCGSSIYTPFTGNDESGNRLTFCDILCGRLYDTDISEINPNMRIYNKLYSQNKLSVQSRKLYERLNEYGLFKTIPICVNQSTPILTKKYYYTYLGV